jgi:hypothetical protein
MTVALGMFGALAWVSPVLGATTHGTTMTIPGRAAAISRCRTDGRSPSPQVLATPEPAYVAGGGALSLIGTELRILWQRSNKRPIGHVQEAPSLLHITMLARPFPGTGLLPSE